jgi:hypothetical protein
MPISNFPAALQPAIQQNYLEREFKDGLRSVLSYRSIATREKFPNHIGETITKTRHGLKLPVTTPLPPNTNTNLDNGLTPSSWTIEQWVMSINLYGDTIDLNTVTEKVGIAEQFLVNAKVSGIQAAQSLDRIARNALFAAYMGGNTFVTATLGAPGNTVHVDNINGFNQGYVNGVAQGVSGAAPLSITIGADTYAVTGAAADTVNTSTTPGGVSGNLTLATNATVSDATSGNVASSSLNNGTGPTVLRPNGRAATSALIATDLLTMASLLDAVAYLRSNGVPTIDGKYNAYADPTALRELFADPAFQLLYRGQGATGPFASGQIAELVDVRIISTTEAFQQTLGAIKVHRTIVCGMGALIEGDFEGMAAHETPQDVGLIKMVDDIVMVVREPLDRLQQIIAQSWYWIGGFSVPTDATANPAVLPTASTSVYKRAVLIEHS